MNRIVSLLTTTVILYVFHAGHCVAADSELQSAAASDGNDLREFISMPDETRQLLRQDMLDHLAALNEINGYLAENDPAAAADVAETRIGMSSMGKHRASGMGPGRYMPLEMRKIGHGMHASASAFARAARRGDMKGAYQALEKMTGSCVACHYSYRTR